MSNIVETELRAIGLNRILGVDEVGRGALCYYVVIGSVMLPVNHKIEGIKDSKLLSPKRREELSKLIYERALDVKITMATNDFIDKYNIRKATSLCMVEAINSCKINPDMVVIDGGVDFSGLEKTIKHPYQILEKADVISENVGAASIVAKVCRDTMMIKVAEQYPQYGFEKHKGYGTVEHVEALLKYGPCPLHRKSFSIKGIKIGDL